VALLAVACTNDVEESGQPVSEEQPASGAVASDRQPDGYGSCEDKWTGQSYHLCVWILNATYGFQARTAEQIAAGEQPQATAGTTYRFEGIDQPWGSRHDGGGGPSDQRSGETYYWGFGCRASCGPEVTLKYTVNSPYKDAWSLWGNVEAGPGDDSFDCRWGQYTSCTGRSMHSDEGDYSVGATYTNRPYLVQIDSSVKGTLTRTSATTSNLMTISEGSDPLTAPQTMVVGDRSRSVAWVGGFMEVGKPSNVYMSYALSGNGGLDRTTIKMNAAFDKDGNPAPTKYDGQGKVITSDPATTWCEVIKVGQANLSCRVNSAAGNPDVISFTLVP
jgi:hypothetical protein